MFYSGESYLLALWKDYSIRDSYCYFIAMEEIDKEFFAGISYFF